MTDPSEDEKRLNTISDTWATTTCLNSADVEWILDAARDGLKWRKAAVPENEVDAAILGFFEFDRQQLEPKRHVWNPAIEAMLQAAAAHRAAHGEDIEALKARVAELEKEKQKAERKGYDAGVRSLDGALRVASVMLRGK